MSFCVTTEMWWPVYVEGEGLFYLLCKKHDTSNPQNETKVFNKEPCKWFRPEAFEDHCCMSQHKNAVSVEMLQRVSTFQRTLDERERVAEDVLLKVFTAAYWIVKEELPNHKIKSLLNLLEELGLKDLKRFLHRSQGALREIFLTIGKLCKMSFYVVRSKKDIFQPFSGWCNWYLCYVADDNVCPILQWIVSIN